MTDYDVWKDLRRVALIEHYGSEEKMLEELKDAGYESLNDYLAWEYKDRGMINCYSELDDWTIDQVKNETGESNRNVFAGYTLVDGNLMPDFTNNAKNTVTFAAAKNAKGVSVPATVKIKGKTYKVTSIAAKAFAPAKKKLTSVTIGKNAATIGASAFAGCAKLRMVKGRASVKTIGATAFSGCKVLALCAPLASKALTTIKPSAFKGCKKLVTLTVKSKKLTKKGVKKALASSSVKTVTVRVGKAKANATYAKKYAKFFTKANCGKKVKVQS